MDTLARIFTVTRMVVTIAVAAGTLAGAYGIAFVTADYVTEKSYRGLDERVDTVNESIVALNGSVRELQSSVSDLRVAVSEEVAALRSERDQLAANIAVEVARLVERDSGTRERLDAIERKIDDGFQSILERTSLQDQRGQLRPSPYVVQQPFEVEEPNTPTPQRRDFMIVPRE